MHCRWYPSMPCSRSPELGGGWYPSMPCRFLGPQPRGKLRGIWPRGVCLLQGRVPAPGGGVWRPPPRDGYCCGRYASYWNAFLFTTVVNDLYFQLLRIYAWICLFRDGALKRSKPKDSFKEKYQEDFSKRLKGE